MARNITTRGPRLRQYFFGTGSSTLTTEYLWTKTNVATSVRRKMPLTASTLLAGTSYSAETTYRSRSVVTRSDGSYFPSPENSAPEAFNNDEYQSGLIQTKYKLRAKIKGEEWNLGTFLGELPETLAYFADTLKTVVQLYRSVRKGDMRGVRRLRKRARKGTWSKTLRSSTSEVSSRWLEWRYAVQPLMFDLDAQLKYLYSSSLKSKIQRSVSGSNLHFFESGIYSGNYGGLTYFRNHDMDLRLGCYYTVNPNVQAFKKLGLLNPAAVLWELTPLSFVLDWLIPIGDYLGTLDAMAGVQVLSTWESRTSKTQYFVSGGRSSWLNGDKVEWENKSSDNSYVNSYVRQMGVSLDVPLPSFKLSLNSKRFLDGLALTRSILIK